MTDKQFEDLDKKLDKLMDSFSKIKKILDEMHPYRSKQELIKIGKHDDLTRKV